MNTRAFRSYPHGRFQWVVWPSPRDWRFGASRFEARSIGLIYRWAVQVAFIELRRWRSQEESTAAIKARNAVKGKQAS